MSDKKPIYAVDFDGTLCKSAWPEIGEANDPLIRFLKEKQREEGSLVILWTMREGELLDQAVEWCAERGLHFDAVNDNVKALKEAFGNNPRKAYADLYIDDHNATFWPWDPPKPEMEGYKERMVKEYQELKEKYNKLHKIIIKAEAGTLDFQLNCPIELLKRQKSAMGNYLNCLEVRAEIEGVEL